VTHRYIPKQTLQLKALSKMLKRDVTIGIILIFVSALICYGAIRLGIGNANNPGPGFFPFLAGVAVGIFSLAMIITGAKLPPKVASKTETLINIRSVVILFILLLFGLFVEKLGFYVCSFLLIISLLKITSEKKWPFLLFVAISTSVAVFLIFNLLLDVRLPLGILTFFRTS
jgi:putative tricarboxylic transport membrane protein